MSAAQATRVAVLTPQGRGAVAVVAVQGTLAETVVARYFHARNRLPLERQPFGRIVFGHWGSPTGEEIVLCRRAAGDIEVHCHGGIAAPTAIVEALEQAGCQPVSWTEFLSTTESDSIARTAREALAHACTQRTAAILLDQYRGALRATLNEIERLATSPRSDDRHRAAQLVEELLNRAPLGCHLTSPWQVAIAGQPNVGKSSLINALVGYERAIVFHTPGTTRDVVTALTAFEGWPVELADTAGLRITSDEVEATGVARAEARIATADLVILVFDLTQPWSQADEALKARYSNALIVHNKADVAQPDASRPAGLQTSALMRQGLMELEQAILYRLVDPGLQPGDAVPFTAEQRQTLQSLQARLQASPR